MIAFISDPLAQKKLEKLASHARLPTLCYDSRGIQDFLQQVGQMGRRHHVRFLFPVKAFPHRRMWNWVAKRLDGFDVSNSAELQQVQRFNAKFYSLDWKSQDLAAALVTKIQKSKQSHFLISTESESIFRKYAGLRELNFGLRIDPHSVLSKRLAQRSSTSSRFGFSGSDAIELLRASRVKRTGLHFHYGSEQNTTEHYLAMSKAGLDLARQAGVQLEFLNLGGGIANFDTIEIENLLLKLRQLVPRKTSLILEPGRIFSERFGYALTRVQSLRLGQTIQARLNLSKECHLRWGRPRLILPRRLSPQRRPRRLVLEGPSALETDVILDFKMHGGSPEFKVGEALILDHIAGYCMAWNQSFNGIPKAKIKFF